jgi:poly-gamma-glutamate capsule biosynthesis protein CapA/YwtB (metallophosphatase superfamily)
MREDNFVLCAAHNRAERSQLKLSQRGKGVCRIARLGALAAAVGWSVAASSACAQDQSILITLTGQSMIRSDLRSTAAEAVPKIRSMIQGDVKFTNLEGTVAYEGEAVNDGRGFLIPPAALDCLSAFGFNLLSLSNNHAFDLKRTGLENTLHEVDGRSIVHAGTGETMEQAAAPAYLSTPKGKVALVASASGLIAQGARATESSPGVNELRIEAGNRVNEATDPLPVSPSNALNPEDSRRILKNIRDARAHADLVIVYQHNHVFNNRPFSELFGEGLPERLVPPSWLKKWTHAEINAGADVVVMHGAPLLHGIEIYRGKPIFYDLGNFIYNLPPAITYIDEPINWESVVAYVRFNGRKLQSVKLRPIAMNSIGEGQPDVHNQYTSNQFLHTRGVPAQATGRQATYILERMANASKPFGTTVEVNNDMAEVRLPSR